MVSTNSDPSHAELSKNASSRSNGKTGKGKQSHGGKHQKASTSKHQTQRRRSSKPYEPLRGLTSSEHINITSRFALKSTSHLTPSSINVEKAISPSQIWRVFAPAQECPVCLEIAEVPRMLTCGHVMCLNCMIQHRMLSAAPNMCAICGESVSHQLSNTLAVTFIGCESELLPKEGDDVVLTLMKRNNHSVVALPVNLEMDNALNDLKHFPEPDFILWTRLCHGSLDYATKELANDLKTLVVSKNKCIEEFGTDEGHGNAIIEMKSYISSLKKNGSTLEPKSHANNHPLNSLQASSSATNDHTDSSDTAKQKQESQYSFYYQVAFESPTFYTLSNLDVSILRACFGSYENLPSSLIAKVENIEYGIIDHSNNKRHKFLSHIPEQTPIAYLECDWSEIVPKEILDQFKGKLSEREKHKLSKTAKEIFENEKAAEAIENQFKIEVAEALTPQNGPMSFAPHANINPAALPSLSSKPKPEHLDENFSNLSIHDHSHRPVWVDEKKEDEEVLKNSFVTGKGKGKKKIVLRF